MAKPTTIKIRLNSTAGTGHFYVTKKNARTMTEKMAVNKYDPVVRKHVEYKEGKIHIRQTPVQQDIETWNDTWSEFKAM